MLTYTTIKDSEEEDRAKPNVGNDPVISDEDHTGVKNTANYDIYVINSAEAAAAAAEGKVTYKDISNTVTVKTEYQKDEDEDAGEDDAEEDEDADVDDAEDEEEGVKAADTGDSGDIVMWMIVLLVSVAPLVVMGYRRRNNLN